MSEVRQNKTTTGVLTPFTLSGLRKAVGRNLERNAKISELRSLQKGDQTLLLFFDSSNVCILDQGKLLGVSEQVQVRGQYMAPAPALLLCIQTNPYSSAVSPTHIHVIFHLTSPQLAGAEPDAWRAQGGQPTWSPLKEAVTSPSTVVNKVDGTQSAPRGPMGWAIGAQGGVGGGCWIKPISSGS